MKVKDLIRELSELQDPDWEVYFCRADSVAGTAAAFPLEKVEKRRVDSDAPGQVQVAGEETDDANAAVIFSDIEP